MIMLMILAFLTLQNFATDYAFHPENKIKAFDGYLLKNENNNSEKKVQIRGYLQKKENEGKRIVTLAMLHAKNNLHDEDYRDFFTSLITQSQQQNIAILRINKNALPRLEKFLLNAIKQKYEIIYRFPDQKHFIFSLHLHNNNQTLLSDSMDFTDLFKLKSGINEYVLDIIDRQKRQVIGMITFDSYPAKNCIDIAKAYIASNYRKKGLATRGFQCIERFAIIQQIPFLELYVQPFGINKPERSKLIEWYKRRGFIVNDITYEAKKELSEMPDLPFENIEIDLKKNQL